MIERYFTTSVAVARVTWTGNTSNGSTPVGTITAHVQPTSAEDALAMQMAFGLTHTLWCAADADVRVGDTLTIASGAFAGTYNARSVMKNVAVGRNQHLEVTALKDK